MRFIIVTLITLFNLASAQYPEGWTRTQPAHTQTISELDITHYGEWVNKDETQTLIILGIGETSTPKDFTQKAAGVASGVLRSGIIPLKFGALEKPYIGFAIEGEAEQFYQNTYILIANSKILLVKINSSSNNIQLDFGKLNLGEPSTIDQHVYFQAVDEIVTKLNTNISHFQNSVRKLRKMQREAESTK